MRPALHTVVTAGESSAPSAALPGPTKDGGERARRVHQLRGRSGPVPEQQGRGLALFMLDELVHWSRAQGAQSLWLEVRVSNARARQIYERYGFKAVGLRRNYYPLAAFKREDAVVMSLPLEPGP